MLMFTNIWYLLLLIPIVAGLIYSFQHVHGMMRGRKKLAFALRFILLTSLVVALAGPEAKKANQGLCTIFLLDRSDSVTDSDRSKQAKFVNDAIEKLGPNDQAAVIAFGRDAAVDTAPGALKSIPRILTVVDGSATDIAAAIRLASATFPDGKARRIVLLSDGNETSGDAMEAASVASTENISIDHVALGTNSTTGEASVIETQMPSETRVGQAFTIKVVIDSNIATHGTLILDKDGVIAKKVAVDLVPGKNTIALNETLDDAGFHKFRATLDVAGDRDARNNVGMGFVAVRGKPKVLIVQQDPSKQILAKALQKQNIVADVYGPSGVPTKPEEFQPYDAVIFNDINAESMTTPQMKLLQAAVRDTGIGFMMIGGENSFLPGGYFGTPVAEILPVDLNIRQRKSFPSTSILIICDTSGSMGMIEDGVQKVVLAAKAAEQTVMMMSPMDRVGVVGSTDAIEFVSPMQPCTDKQSIVNQIRKLSVGGGGIYCHESMEFALKHLPLEPSKVRHLLLEADGNDCDTQEGCFEIAMQLKAMHITTSVISIGEGKDVEFLKKLAAIGGGKFYLAKKAGQMAALSTQDAATTARSAIEEGAFLPKIAIGEEILRGIDSSSVPPLFAYDLTDSRPLSRIGMKTQKDDPLLASWQYGLGTSVAFTSDAQNRWAAQWVPWGGFGQFWAQAVRSVSRRASSNTYQVNATHDGSRGVVDIDARDSRGNPINELPAQVKVSLPNGESREVPVSQVGPGQFKGTFSASDLGSYIVTLAEKDATGKMRASSTGFSLPYPPEYRSFRANRSLLQRISNATGGAALTAPTQAARVVTNPGYSIQELWMFFVLLAALMLPLDIASRRLAIPFAEAYAKVIGWLKTRKAERAVVATPAHVDRLQKAKQKVETKSGEPSQPGIILDNPSEKRQPAAAKPSGTAASQLLAAKRKRKEGDND